MATAWVERRLAAILAADVVGYSRLVEQDEAGTLAALKVLRREVIDPLLAEHHGRIVKLMGDGAIAEFGSVVDAVLCAVAVQKGVAERQADVPPERRIVFRIGINLGDVVVEGKDLLGDGVNVAARLEQLCEPGGVLISGTAYDHLHGKVIVPLDFAGEQKVKNIERPIRTYRITFNGKLTSWRPFGHLKRWAPAAAMVLLALGLLGGISRFYWPGSEPPVGKPAIAVLPFDNLPGDQSTGLLADGLTEDIITDLARFRDLAVIARNSTAVYKGRPVDVREVGRNLNVGYVLEGSVQRQADRLRVTAQLIDATTGAHVWSDRWDRPLEDVFAVQTEVAEKVAAQLGGYTGSILAAGQDTAKRKRPENLSAYELYLLGVEAKHRETRESVEEAIRLLKRSLEIDPKFARAWTALAWSYTVLKGWVDDTLDMRRTRLGAARRAVELDPQDAEAHAALGSMLGQGGDLAEAEAELDQAVSLNPNSADILTFYADWASAFGKPEKGVEAAERAIRLNPHMPSWALNTYAYAFFMVGRYEKALRVLDRKPRETYRRNNFVFRAASLAATGQAEEARAAVAETLARFPGLTIESFAVFDPSWSAAERLRLVETMRAAGFPACAKAEELSGLQKPARLPECSQAEAAH
ncbi:adenylate/guanylate cyclase domain-containing protein [Microvirga massiliensis]|uniref:adenylate/guanylate cyclase domain-containing protein n=1 Tax=Microvirga massiliensis TaxID=1033741 RepID=UPI00062B61AA|nr:adenylate/guanylate cyclase domain-containing protein [Microvirga massiliensis]